VFIVWQERKMVELEIAVLKGSSDQW
jgi:hypothetical protein